MGIIRARKKKVSVLTYSEEENHEKKKIYIEKKGEMKTRGVVG